MEVGYFAVGILCGSIHVYWTFVGYAVEASTTNCLIFYGVPYRIRTGVAAVRVG
jgi:hypothetical protein